MSGYVDCACRDCFEIAIASEDPAPNCQDRTLCWECEEAGCDPEGKNACEVTRPEGDEDEACP